MVVFFALPNDIICDKYKIIKLVSNGDTAKIFTANDMQHNEDIVILKIFNGYEGNVAHQQELEFLKQANGRLGFPTLIEYFTMEHEEMEDFTFFCIVMTHEGETLEKLMTRQKFQICGKNLLRLAYRIHQLITKIHEIGFFHRDLHVGNILLKKDWKGEIDITVIDFGFCTSADSTQLDEDMISWFASLDVVNGKPFTGIDDIYSLVNILIWCSKKDPFGDIPSNYVLTKTVFDQHIDRIFTRYEHKWIGDLYKLLKTQKSNGYNKYDIQRLFENVYEGFDPTTPIAYTLVNGKLVID